MSANFYLYHFVILNIYFILSLSLNLINGHCGLFSLGHAGFMAIGAYVGAFAINFLHLHYAAVFEAGPFLWMLASCGAGFLGAGLAGLLIGLPCVRLKGDYLAIATLAFGSIIHQLILSSETLGGNRGYEVAPVTVVRQSRRLMQVMGLEMPQSLFYNLVFTVVSVLSVIMVCFVIQRLIRSSHGRAIIAIREDEKAASLLGIPTARYKLIVFFIGSGFAGYAGALYAHYLRLIGPADFDLMKTVTILLMVVLGGMGSRYGVLFATFILYAIPEILRANLVSFWIQSSGASSSITEAVTKVSNFMTDSFQIVYALLLIVLMILRPQGIFGKAAISSVILKPRRRLREKAEATS